MIRLLLPVIVLATESSPQARLRGASTPLSTVLSGDIQCWARDATVWAYSDGVVLSLSRRRVVEEKNVRRSTLRRAIPPAALTLDCVGDSPETRAALKNRVVLVALREIDTNRCVTNAVQGSRVLEETWQQQAQTATDLPCATVGHWLEKQSVPSALALEIQGQLLLEPPAEDRVRSPTLESGK